MTNQPSVLKQMIIMSLLVLIFFTWCNRQNTSQTTNNTLTDQTRSVKGDTVQQVGENIRSILQDKNGNFWFGSDGQGVYRYDGKNIVQFTDKDGLCNNQIITIQEDASGNIYFNTGGGGVSRFDGHTFTTLSNEESNFNTPNKEWKNEPGSLWFVAKEGVYCYSNNLPDNLKFPKSSLDAKYYAENPGTAISPYGVYCIFKDSRGNLWFGTEYMGVCRYDGKSFTWFTEKGLDIAAIRTISEDKNGNLWFGSIALGLFRYDGKTVINFSDENGLANSDFIKALVHKKFKLTRDMSKEGTLASIMSIINDKDDLWIGTLDAGVWRYDGKKLTNYTTKDGLSSNAITAIYKDKKGVLWFGTEGKGVCKYDGRTFSRFTL